MERDKESSAAVGWDRPLGLGNRRTKLWVRSKLGGNELGDTVDDTHWCEPVTDSRYSSGSRTPAIAVSTVYGRHLSLSSFDVAFSKGKPLVGTGALRTQAENQI